MRLLWQCCFIIVLTVLASSASANKITPIDDDTRVFGPYTVYYNTFNSLFIPAEIAKIHHLVRANDQTLINIAIKETATGRSVPATINATASNLMQQSKAIDIKTISEPDAVYYIGAIRHVNEELYHIDISLQIEGSEEINQFRITRKLYTE